MESQMTMYISLVTTSGVLSVFLCLYAFIKRTEIPGARIFIAYMISLCIYIFGYALSLTGDTVSEVMFWTVVLYIGMPFSPVLGLMVVLKYIGKTVSKTAFSALLAIPAITLAMVATNDYHHLFYKSVTPRPGLPIPLAEFAIGEWYVVHGAYTFGCILAGAVLLFRQWRHTRGAYRPQLLTLIFGQCVPMITAFLYLIGATPNGLDPVPIVMCGVSALYIWAMVSSHMLKIVPIARGIVFESMREGVIVLDSSDRLVDYNSAVGRMIPGLTPSLLGKTLNEVWTGLTGAPFPIAGRTDGMQEDLEWGKATDRRHYQVRTSTVRNRGGEQAGSLLMLIDMTEQKRLQEQLEHLAYHDGLTQLYNRTHFIGISKAMLEETRAQGQPVSIVLFDIDRFKRVNDTYGHETGDRMIVHVVSVCRLHLPEDTLFARYGGEEFVIALPATTLEEAGAVAERLRAALEASPLPTENGPIRVSSSFGVAQSGRPGDTLESLLQDADAALYEAKRSGRNAVRLFAPGS